jgi:hypothetical protein
MPYNRFEKYSKINWDNTPIYSPNYEGVIKLADMYSDNLDKKRKEKDDVLHAADTVLSKIDHIQDDRFADRKIHQERMQQYQSQKDQIQQIYKTEGVAAGEAALTQFKNKVTNELLTGDLARLSERKKQYDEQLKEYQNSTAGKGLSGYASKKIGELAANTDISQNVTSGLGVASPDSYTSVAEHQKTMREAIDKLNPDQIIGLLRDSGNQTLIDATLTKLKSGVPFTTILADNQTKFLSKGRILQTIFAQIPTMSNDFNLYGKYELGKEGQGDLIIKEDGTIDDSNLVGSIASNLIDSNAYKQESRNTMQVHDQFGLDIARERRAAEKEAKDNPLAIVDIGVAGNLKENPHEKHNAEAADARLAKQVLSTFNKPPTGIDNQGRLNVTGLTPEQKTVAEKYYDATLKLKQFQAKYNTLTSKAGKDAKVFEKVSGNYHLTGEALKAKSAFLSTLPPTLKDNLKFSKAVNQAFVEGIQNGYNADKTLTAISGLLGKDSKEYKDFVAHTGAGSSTSLAYNRDFTTAYENASQKYHVAKNKQIESTYEQPETTAFSGKKLDGFSTEIAPIAPSLYVANAKGVGEKTFRDSKVQEIEKQIGDDFKEADVKDEKYLPTDKGTILYTATVKGKPVQIILKHGDNDPKGKLNTVYETIRQINDDNSPQAVQLRNQLYKNYFTSATPADFKAVLEDATSSQGKLVPTGLQYDNSGSFSSINLKATGGRFQIYNGNEATGEYVTDINDLQKLYE